MFGHQKIADLEQVSQAHWTAPWHEGHCWISGTRTQIRSTTCVSDCTHSDAVEHFPSLARMCSMSSLFTITSTYHPTGKFLWALASPAWQFASFYLKILYLVLANTMPSTEVWWRKVLIWSLLIYIFSSLFSHFSNVLIKCFTQYDFVSMPPRNSF